MRYHDVTFRHGKVGEGGGDRHVKGKKEKVERMWHLDSSDSNQSSSVILGIGFPRQLAHKRGSSSSNLPSSAGVEPPWGVTRGKEGEG